MDNQENCEHHFVFLRQEIVDAQQHNVKLVRDVFFCDKRLTYKIVPIREETFSRQSFEVVVIKRYQ